MTRIIEKWRTATEQFDQITAGSRWRTEDVHEVVAQAERLHTKFDKLKDQLRQHRAEHVC